MPSKRRAAVCLENSSQQPIQVIQVILTPLPQRFLAAIKVIHVAGQAVPARARAAQLGLGRGRPLRSRRCPRPSFR